MVCIIQKFSLLPHTEIELLSQHGVLLPGNMQGLTEEQIRELKLKDEYEDTCMPSGGYVMNPDPMGRKNGRGVLRPRILCMIVYTMSLLICAAPNDKMKDVLKRTISEAKASVSKVHNL